MKALSLRLLLLASIIALAGLFSYLRFWNEPDAFSFFPRLRSPKGLALLASRVPRNAGLLVALDLREHMTLGAALERWRPQLKENPQALRVWEEMERRLGAKAEDVARWAQASAFLAALPAEGHARIWDEPDVVFGAQVADEAQARDFLHGALSRDGQPAQEEILGNTKFWVKDNVYLGLKQGFILGGTSRKAVESLLTTFAGKAESIAVSPHWVAMRNKLELDHGGLVLFVPLDGQAEALPGWLGVEAGDHVREGLRGLTCLICSLRFSRGRLVAAGWLGMDPQSPSPVIKALLSHPGSSFGSPKLVPAAWGNYVVLNARYLTKVVMEALQADEQMAEWERRAGLSLEKDVWPALSGEVACSSDGLKDLPRLLQGEATHLLAIGVNDSTLAEQLLAKLDLLAGPSTPSTKVGDTQLFEHASLRLTRCLLAKPRPTILLAVGPRAHEMLTEALQVQPSVAQAPLFQAAWRSHPERWVGAAYLDLLPAIASMPEGADATEALRRMVQGVKEASGSIFLTVDPDGLLWLAQGGGTVTADGVGAAAAIALPKLVRFHAQSQLSACESHLQEIGTSLEIYAVDHQGRYPTSLNALTPNYLRRLPVCPAGGKDSYSLKSLKSSKGYTLCCQGAHHAGAGLPECFPQYTAAQGLLVKP